MKNVTHLSVKKHCNQYLSAVKFDRFIASSPFVALRQHEHLFKKRDALHVVGLSYGSSLVSLNPFMHIERIKRAVQFRNQ
ncbi:MAG: hypothetical protein QCI00_00015 [Candidatus Thermoplasmatota archaeon]|nr:hypothetical protein [Candidatus Thermoplasmatota archaeon]